MARQYKENNDLYKQTAAYWTYAYAIQNKTDEMARHFAQFDSEYRLKVEIYIPPAYSPPHSTDCVRQLMTRCQCDRNIAMNALSCNYWDIERAANAI